MKKLITVILFLIGAILIGCYLYYEGYFDDIPVFTTTTTTTTKAVETTTKSTTTLPIISQKQKYEYIMSNKDKYTDIMIEDVEFNKEIIDFLYDYPNAEHEVTGGFTTEEKSEEIPLLLQFDSRWGYEDYGSSVIGISGCCPTALSMVCYALTRNDLYTPDYIAHYSMNHGYYQKGKGTLWGLCYSFAQSIGIKSTFSQNIDETKVKECIDSGGYVICNVGKGDFTVHGHYIVIAGYEDGKVTVLDPFSKEKSEKQWDYSVVAKQTKAYWTFN